MKIKKVILHCSATKDYAPDHKKFNSINTETIRKWHIHDRNFSDVGYHYIILRDGTIEKGREDNVIGAHCYGYNSESLGVCIVGTSLPTDYQVKSLKKLYMDILDKYGVDYNNWFGHYEYNKHKECPSIPMSLVRALLESTGKA